MKLPHRDLESHEDQVSLRVPIDMDDAGVIPSTDVASRLHVLPSFVAARTYTPTKRVSLLSSILINVKTAIREMTQS